MHPYMTPCAWAAHGLIAAPIDPEVTALQLLALPARAHGH